jgi:hypothetical protein
LVVSGSCEAAIDTGLGEDQSDGVNVTVEDCAFKSVSPEDLPTDTVAVPSGGDERLIINGVVEPSITDMSGEDNTIDGSA